MHKVIRPDDFDHDYVRAGNLSMHTVLEGNANAPLVVLLHGFPEFWYSWRYQIKPLAEAGYRVVAPDMRGYNLSEKHGPYDVFTIVEDVMNFIRALGREKAIIVGHDWGSMIAWLFAALRSDMTEKLIVCNLPHPKAAQKAFKSFYFPQWLKSWYIGFFQLPLIPEIALRANNYRVMAEGLRTALPDGMTEQELDFYREAWAQKGALSAMLGYYRALPRRSHRVYRTDLTVRVPAQLIWGEPDIALDTKLAQWSSRWCSGLDLRIIPNSNHFVQLYAAEQVTGYMLEFLAKQPTIDPVREYQHLQQ
jgi:epoxide hydrolase 4